VVFSGERPTQIGPKLIRVAVRLCAASLFALCPWAAIASCWEHAAANYGLDPLLLKAIGWQESRGWSHAVGPKLPDDHQALGVMQINTVHLATLRALGIGRSDLFDPCVNQSVGAWVLADCMVQFGNTWRAVGCYYAGPRSRNVAKQAEYVRAVMRHYEGYRSQQVSALPIAEAANP